MHTTTNTTTNLTHATDCDVTNQLAEKLTFIRRLLEGNVVIAADVVEISHGTWAIHGVIPVDGDVLVAEFPTYDGARRALDALATDPCTGRVSP